MGKVITPQEMEKERPKRPKRPNASIDAVLRWDVPKNETSQNVQTPPVDWEDEPFEPGLPSPLRERPADRVKPKKARRARLTDEYIASLEPESRQFYVWDARWKGMGVRIGASGTVAFVVKLNLPGKRSVWKTLEARTLENAGIEYHEVLAKFGKGEPLPKRPEKVLWQDVVDRFQLEHLPRLKPRTQVSYRSALKLVRAALLNRPVRGITYQDIRAFHESLSGKSRTGNVCVGLTKLILDRCEAWGFRDQGSNPVDLLRKSGWKPFHEVQRDRPLSDDELGQIGQALWDMESTESPYTIGAVRLLLLTGKRLREILDLQWKQIDLDLRVIRWEVTKTGAMSAPLNDAALAVLQCLPRLEGNPYVLPGATPGRPIVDLKRFWGRLLKAAGIVDLHRHDLRHAHGNEAAGLGLNMQTTAALLGHRDPHTTARYSKTGQHPALQASEQVSGSLSRKLAKKAGR